jgi:hypothetical protein
MLQWHLDAARVRSTKESQMSEPVDHYRVNLFSIEGRQEGKIVLHCGNGHTLNLIFVDSTGTLPPNTFDAGTKTGTAHARFDMYQHYLDLLRNEGPNRVSFILGGATPSFRVQSGLEVPGEGG